MVTRVFTQDCIVFRPTTPKNTSARTTYTRIALNNVKLDSFTKHPNQQQGYSGVLFYNIGISTSTDDVPVKTGDFVTTDTTATTLPAERFTIASVKDCIRNGELHHYECELK